MMSMDTMQAEKPPSQTLLQFLTQEIMTLNKIAVLSCAWFAI